jgi:hypothetical protein
MDLSVLQLLAFILAYTACAAFASPQMIGASRAVETRYMVALLPILSLLWAVVIARLFRWNKAVAIMCGVLFIYTNLLTLAPAQRAITGRKPIIAWRLTGYMKEIRRERTTSYEAGMALIDKHVNQDETVFFFPEYAILPHIFYQGDRILFSSVVIDDGSPVWRAAREKLPGYVTQNPARADWILVYGKPWKDLKNLLDVSFKLRDRADVYWYDTTRPEPEQHTFRQLKRRPGIALYRRIEYGPQP